MLKTRGFRALARRRALACRLQSGAGMDNSITLPRLRTLTFWTLLVVAALAAFGAATAHAQLADLKIASVGYEYYPYAETEETALSPGGTEVAFQSFRANLTLPIML